MILLLVIVLILGVIVLLLIGLSQPDAEQRVARRREQYLQPAAPTLSRSAVSEELASSFTDRVLVPVWRNIVERFGKVAPEGMIEAARAKLDSAGHPFGITEPVFLLARAMAAFLGAAVAYSIFGMLDSMEPMMRIAVTLFVLLVIVMAPDYYVGNCQKTRQAQIRRALPDLLDLLVVCTEAGMGLDAALAEVVSRKEGPLVDEFARTLVEVRLGKPRNDSWQDMADRAAVQEVSTLVASLYQAQTMGVSIARALRTHADALRTQRSIRIKEQSAVLSTKMLFPLVLCIFPALFVVVLGPGAVQVMQTFGGGGGPLGP
jgi:tight adherence protein C